MNRYLISNDEESRLWSTKSSRDFDSDYRLIYQSVKKTGTAQGMRFEQVMAWTRAEELSGRGRKKKVNT